MKILYFISEKGLRSPGLAGARGKSQEHLASGRESKSSRAEQKVNQTVGTIGTGSTEFSPNTTRTLLETSSLLAHRAGAHDCFLSVPGDSISMAPRTRTHTQGTVFSDTTDGVPHYNQSLFAACGDLQITSLHGWNQKVLGYRSCVALGGVSEGETASPIARPG